MGMKWHLTKSGALLTISLNPGGLNTYATPTPFHPGWDWPHHRCGIDAALCCHCIRILCVQPLHSVGLTISVPLLAAIATPGLGLLPLLHFWIIHAKSLDLRISTHAFCWPCPLFWFASIRCASIHCRRHLCHFQSFEIEVRWHAKDHEDEDQED